MTGQKTIFLFIKELARTCQPMNTVAETAGKPKSPNFGKSGEKGGEKSEKRGEG